MDKKLSVIIPYINCKEILYHSLSSYSKSKNINNCEFIIIDDCNDEKNKIHEIKKDFPKLNIRLIEIEASDKDWNSNTFCLNLGIKLSIYDIIVIANPESFPIGDVLTDIIDNIKENQYLVYGCYSVNEIITKKILATNVNQKTDIISMLPLNTEVKLLKEGTNAWYQHSHHRSVKYPFFAAIYKKDIERIGGFNDIYAAGIGYSDNELVYKIEHSGIVIIQKDDPFVLNLYNYQKNYEYSSLITDLAKRNQSLFDRTKSGINHICNKYDSLYEKYTNKNRTNTGTNNKFNNIKPNTNETTIKPSKITKTTIKTNYRIPEIIKDRVIIPENNGIISYIIPVYNMASTIDKTIQSCLQQNYSKKEIIIIDDGSTDNIKDIIEKYNSNKNIKYFKQENMGAGQALNRGIKESIGEYISWISADDYYIDVQATAKRIDVLEKYPELDFVYSGFIDIINGKENIYKVLNFNTKEEAYNYNKQSCLINGSTLLMRRKVIYSIGLFNYCYRYRQDYDYWFRLLKFHKGFGIDESLIARTNEVNLMARELIVENSFARKVFDLELEMINKHLRMFEKSRPTITAMLCMKNEDDLIEGCIDDLLQWTDKIVIFNDGSTDNSPYRAAKYAKVSEIYNQKNKGNIRTEGKDRQKLLEIAQAQGTDYLLFIDVDEVFENSIKWNIFDLINNEQGELYSFLEVNFWRGLTHYRIDELWYKGWFKRLFRNRPGLMIYDQHEHCGGVPYNIKAEPIQVPNVRVKHYGFADWQRNVDRYKRRMERDPFDSKTGRGGAAYYDRMINEKGLEVIPYEGDVIKSLLPPEEITIIDPIKEVSVINTNIEKSKNHKKLILLLHPENDPACVGLNLTKALRKYTNFEVRHIVGLPTFLNSSSSTIVGDHDLVLGGDLRNCTKEQVEELIEKADILHFSQWDWNKKILGSTSKNGSAFSFGEIFKIKDKKIIFQGHGGAWLLNPDERMKLYKENNVKVITCSPIDEVVIEGAEWMPNMLGLDTFDFTPNFNKDFKGKLHASLANVCPLYKGGGIVEYVFEYLNKFGYDISFQILNNYKKQESFDIRKNHHITIDNWVQGFTGLAGLEGLAMGHIVVGRLSQLAIQNWEMKFEQLPPFENVEGMDECAKRMRMYYNDRDLLKHQSLTNRQWIENYYTDEKISKIWENLYDNL